MNTRTTVLSLLLLLCVSCAGQRQREALAADREDQIVALRTALAELERDPEAARVGPDLARAEGWIQQAQAKLAQRRPQRDEVDLLLLAAKQQVVQIRSYLDRHAAEAALSDTGAEQDQLRIEGEALSDSNRAERQRILEE